MAATLRSDTLKFVRRLSEAGMDRPLAEAIVEGLADADTSALATKADLTRFMMLQAATIVGLTVTLLKLLP